MKRILLILSLTIVLGLSVNATDFSSLDDALTSNVKVIPKTGGKNSPFPYISCDNSMSNKQCLHHIKKVIDKTLSIQKNDEKSLTKINKKYKKYGYKWTANKYTKEELIKRGKYEILSHRGAKPKFYYQKIRTDLVKPNEKQLLKACYDKDLRKLFYKSNEYRKFPWIITKRTYLTNGLTKYRVLKFKNCGFTTEVLNVGSDDDFPYIEKLK